MDKFRMAVEELPELETDVAVAGSAKQQEVAGPWCGLVVVGIFLGSL